MNIRKLNKDLGSYIPAFYNMELSFPFFSGVNALQTLKEKDLAVFVHEYLHFLQDITTYVGLNNAYVYSEYIHAAVTIAYDEGLKNHGAFRVPIHITGNYGNVELNQQVNKVGMGDFEKENNVFSIGIKTRLKNVKYANPFVTHLKEVIIKAGGGKQFRFGYMAIMESMAYMMEKMITKGSGQAADFPYSAAEMVVNEVYPNFGKDKLNIIALCDMALQFSEPGKIFYQTLKTFKQTRYLPSKPEDIIDHFYITPCIQLGQPTMLLNGLIGMTFMVGNRLKEYLRGKEFSSYHNVVHTLLGFGLDQRVNHRYFMLDLARGGYALNNKTLQNTIRRIGSPIIKDSMNDYWHIPPMGVRRENYSIEYFPAILEINKFLKKGNDICEMYEWCEKSPNTQEDLRCIDKPWTRCNDAELCPYAALWKHWNLAKFTPVN